MMRPVDCNNNNNKKKLLLIAEAFVVATAQNDRYAVSQGLVLASTDAAICGAQAKLQSLRHTAGQELTLLMYAVQWTCCVWLQPLLDATSRVLRPMCRGSAH